MSFDIRIYTNNYRKKRKIEAIALLGGRCKQCGLIDNLEFDHIDPSTRINTIASMWTASKKLFYKELAKCQLLCRSCHIKKCIAEGSFNNPWNKGKITHGSAYVSVKCRCDICKKWQADRTRIYRIKKKARVSKWIKDADCKSAV